MKKFIVTGDYASFRSGTLKLTEEQYKAREHALEPLGKGLYRVVAPTGFKRGEEVGFDGEVNKALLHLLEDVTPIEPGKDKPLLDRKVDEIKKALPEFPEESLLALLEEECSGKARKGVIEAIEAEIDARAQAKENDEGKTE